MASARDPLGRVGVVGLGLIGGSVLRNGARAGFDADAATRAEAAAAGAAVCTSLPELLAAIGPAGLVVVAVPVDAMDGVFAALRACEFRGLVTDVGSVKQPVVASARAHGLRFVGGHPMTGRERAGFGASDAGLFAASRWVLTLDAATDLADWLTAAQLVISLEAGVVALPADAHDRAVGLVSHVPHAFAAQLAQRAASDPAHDLALALAAGSFRDSTRVAHSPAAFWRAVFLQNAEVVAALLEESAAAFGALADAVRTNDAAAVERFFAAGNAARARYEARTTVAHEVELDLADEPATRAALLALGAIGGSIQALTVSGSRASLHVRAPEAAAP